MSRHEMKMIHFTVNIFCFAASNKVHCVNSFKMLNDMTIY